MNNQTASAFLGMIVYGIVFVWKTLVRLLLVINLTAHVLFSRLENVRVITST